MSTWDNDDGLRIKYGQVEVEESTGGAYNTDGPYRVLEFDVYGGTGPKSLPAHNATNPTKYLSDVIMLAEGDHIEKGEFYVQEAFAGATATLTFGTYQSDRTVLDADGLDAAIAVTAIDAVGDLVALDGAQINTTLAEKAYVTALAGTASFTAGKGKLRLYITNELPTDA